MPEILSNNKRLRLARTAKIIDGKKIAQDIRNEIKTEIDSWVDQGHRRPCLIAILVGENPASQKYVQSKMVAAKEVGIDSKTITLPESTSESEILSQINQLNQDPSVDGILVQLPVPEHVNERKVCNAVDPRKDVDGFHTSNIGKLTLNIDTFVPATALGVVELIKRYDIPTFGKNVVICGRSKNVGLPMMLLLHADKRNELPGHEATVTLCHRHTPPEELDFFAKKADIIISATGVVNLIKAEMVKPGACIIDVGINRIKTESGKSKIVGDVDFEGVSKVAGHITPVPGGVGPMTVAMLMFNTLKAAKQIVNNNSTS
ncbi:bifunctional methylenetetrahydrofolate dehydrogenase/cyclohydrolase, mitochondrial isoform X2 [Anthonomus grandis grandis]|uniref:bifunctional methylenetetrahydrofolate dehydrogenase/cyclohydrolase, mitochondrial isoform X2 n=1 Tax=Anthonomus grandis grandis TaxID=2921223 RepID=UPI0021650573|nr:bifunctional methylenetetrahydrofolate dehydrogenase/cyclohydrolase, mitochondrial isoform X2 [Anthonomus grandis grandis]